MLPSYVFTTSLQADAFRMEDNNQRVVEALIQMSSVDVCKSSWHEGNDSYVQNMFNACTLAGK